MFFSSRGSGRGLGDGVGGVSREEGRESLGPASPEPAVPEADPISVLRHKGQSLALSSKIV